MSNDEGDIYSLRTGRKLDPAPQQNYGYLQLGILDDGGQKMQPLAHRLIYECHHGLIPEGFEIDHIDGNKANNSIKNLTCLTRAEHNKKTHKDNPHLAIIFSKSKCQKVLRVSAETGESTEYKSVTAAAKSVMGYTSAIRKAIMDCHGSCGGYYWSYVEDCDLEGEFWKPVVDNNIDGVTVVFKVSNLGRLQYANLKKKTYGIKYSKGYLFCYLGKKYGVHELICQVFKGSKPTPEHTADHINRDPFDNRPQNLRWSTRQEQSRNRRSVRTVEGYLNTGFSLGIWPTISDAAAATGTHASSIGKALKGKRQSSGKTEAGEKICWRYKDSLVVSHRQLNSINDAAADGALVDAGLYIVL